MAARIRSLKNAITPVDEASRDDIVVGDLVTVQSLDAAASYSWALVYVPEGSVATFSGSLTAVSPGSFTADLSGSYLVRLVVDANLVSESTQYVRLRVLTTGLSLRLVAAGERRDDTGVIPVDADPTGWADDQNYNLLSLEAASSGVSTFVSGEALALNDVVMFDTNAAGGRVIKSNAGTAGRKFVVGIARATVVAAGLSVGVTISTGRLVVLTFDAPPVAGNQGQAVYLHTVNGQVSLTAPVVMGTTVIRVGILQNASTRTVLFIPQFISNN